MTDNTFLPSRFTRTSTGITLYSAAAKFDELRRNILLKERLILSQPKSIGLYREGSVFNHPTLHFTPLVTGHVHSCVSTPRREYSPAAISAH